MQHTTPADKKHKVAIIDPFPTFRGMLYKIIRNRLPHADIAVADTIDKALQVIETEAPDLVFLDIALFPEKCVGYIQAMKASLPASVIVVLTTHDSAEHKAAFLEHGADYFLSKTDSSGPILIDVIEKSLL
jgi:DNA-binding response OmpR family regulator